MIRKWVAKDNTPLLALWLDSTIHAHPFISESYWRDSVAVVRDVYLPAASTWVWERDGELKALSACWSPASSARCSSRRTPFARALAGRCWMKSSSTTPGLALRFIRKTNQRSVSTMRKASALKIAHGRTILSTPPGLCAGRRIKCCKRQRRAGIFLQPRQGGVPGTAVAQPGCRDIFG